MQKIGIMDNNSKLKNISAFIARVLGAPFTKWSSLALLLFLISWVPVIFYKEASSVFLFNKLKGDCVWIYYTVLLTAVIGEISCKWGRIAGRFMVGVWSLAMTIIMMLYYFVGEVDLCIFVGVAQGTNLHEVSGFFHQYFTAEIWAKFLPAWMASMVLVIALYSVLNPLAGRMAEGGRVWHTVSTLLGIGVILANIHFIRKDNLLAGEVTAQNVFKYVAEMLFPSKPISPESVEVVVSDATLAPQELVIIIGESLTKTHMSLYGYAYPTTPMLEELQRDSSLIVFRNVESPDVHTVDSFNQFMVLGDEVAGKRYEFKHRPVWIDVLRNGGYETIWISNQAKYGAFDNIPAQYASFSDTVIWSSPGNSAWYSQSEVHFDEQVLKDYRRWVKSKSENNGDKHKRLTIFHLNGSHPVYAGQYPPERSKFRRSDYGGLPAHQRQTVADYDNSVSYNDSVVVQIMREFSGKDAMVIYFSDHGQDLYDTRTDYAGHSILRDEASFAAGSRIPMVIYVSESYQRRHPEMVKKLRDVAGKQFNVRDISPTLMDISGIKLKNPDNNFMRRSLLRPHSPKNVEKK